MSTPCSNYTRYERNDAVAKLDMNTYDMVGSVTMPRGMYGGPPTKDAYYICSRPRNTDTHYIIDRERLQHPDHFSRFGYARAFNGYGVGHWPGRYRTNDLNEYDAQPRGVAPARMYSVQNVRGTDSALCVKRYGKRDYHSSKQFLKY